MEIKEITNVNRLLNIYFSNKEQIKTLQSENKQIEERLDEISKSNIGKE